MISLTRYRSPEAAAKCPCISHTCSVPPAAETSILPPAMNCTATPAEGPVPRQLRPPPRLSVDEKTEPPPVPAPCRRPRPGAWSRASAAGRWSR